LFSIQKPSWGGTDSWLVVQGLQPLFSKGDVLVSATQSKAHSRWVWTQKFPDATSLELRLGGSMFGRDMFGAIQIYQSLNPLQPNSGAQLAQRETVNSNTLDTSWTTSGKLKTPLTWNDKILSEHNFAAGWDIELTRRNEDRIQRQTSPLGLPLINLDEAYKTKLTRAAVCIQDEFDFNKTQSGYVGLRLETVQTQNWSVADSLNVNSMAASRINNTVSVWSPVVQWVFNPEQANADKIKAHSSQWRVGLRRTFKPPTTRDLVARRWVSSQNSVLTPDGQGNGNLVPELAWGLELAHDSTLERKAIGV
jgi:outer membrane receptor for ferrienterochelin and colicins